MSILLVFGIVSGIALARTIGVGVAQLTAAGAKVPTKGR